MDRPSINDVQLWLANGVRLLPAVEIRFLAQLAEMQRVSQRVCLLPQYALQNYSNHIRQTI